MAGGFAEPTARHRRGVDRRSLRPEGARDLYYHPVQQRHGVRALRLRGRGLLEGRLSAPRLQRSEMAARPLAGGEPASLLGIDIVRPDGRAPGGTARWLSSHTTTT